MRIGTHEATSDKMFQSNFIVLSNFLFTVRCLALSSF